jgi:hypothetical protein
MQKPDALPNNDDMLIACYVAITTLSRRATFDPITFLNG